MNSGKTYNLSASAVFTQYANAPKSKHSPVMRSNSPPFNNDQTLVRNSRAFPRMSAHASHVVAITVANAGPINPTALNSRTLNAAFNARADPE